jgi:hypothetical protein
VKPRTSRPTSRSFRGRLRHPGRFRGSARDWRNIITQIIPLHRSLQSTTDTKPCRRASWSDPQVTSANYRARPALNQQAYASRPSCRASRTAFHLPDDERRVTAGSQRLPPAQPTSRWTPQLDALSRGNPGAQIHGFGRGSEREGRSVSLRHQVACSQARADVDLSTPPCNPQTSPRSRFDTRYADSARTTRAVRASFFPREAVRLLHRKWQARSITSKAPNAHTRSTRAR